MIGLASCVLAMALTVPQQAQSVFDIQYRFTLDPDVVRVPWSYELTARDELLVTDVDAKVVHVFDRDGRRTRAIGGKGLEPGSLQFPIWTATSADGTTWVLDRRAEGIKEYDGSGAFQRFVCRLWGDQVMRLERGDFLVSGWSQDGHNRDSVRRYSPDCTVLWSAGPMRPEAMPVFEAFGLVDTALARDRNGLLYSAAGHSMEIVAHHEDGREKRRISLRRPGVVAPSMPPDLRPGEHLSQERIYKERSGWHYLRGLLVADERLLPVYHVPSTPGKLLWGFDVLKLDGSPVVQGIESELRPVAARADGTVVLLSWAPPPAYCPCKVYFGKLRKDLKKGRRTR